MKRWRLAYLASHPIQYQAPLLRLLARHPQISLQVFFCSDLSVQGYTDKEFERYVQWDTPLLQGYEHEFLPAWGRRDRPSFFRPYVRGIKNALRRGEFDFLWVHGWGHWSHLRAIVLAKRLGIKILLRGESNLRLPPGGAVKRRLKRAFLKWLFGKVDGFLAIGKLNQEFYASCGINPDRIYPVPYAVDNEFFQQTAAAAADSRERLRADLKLENGRSVILYASKFTARKRPGDLLEAYRQLSPDGRQEPLPYLLFIGDGELREPLERRAAGLGWNSIRFLGFKNQSALPAYYDLCNVFVLPSDAEPWGLVVNEVMNTRRAPIVTDQVGCAPDLIEDGVTGFVVPVGDVDVLADRLRRMTGDVQLMEKMGQAAYERVSRWGFEQDVRGVLDAMNSL